MNNNENSRLLIEIAYMYYDEDMKQSDIGKELNMSRSLVSRYLTKAKEMGIVQFVINDDFFNSHYKLENEIKLKYGLKHVICVDNNKNKKIQRRRVATASGKYLTQQLKKDSIVAIAGGTTVNQAIESIVTTDKFPDTKFVSIVGGFEEKHRNIQSNFVCEKAAKKTGGEPTFLYAPVIVDSVTAKGVFVNQTYIKNVFNEAKKADLALLGIGGHPEEDSSIAQAYKKYLNTDDTFNSLEIIGDFCYQFIDKFGNLVDCEWNKRVISLDFKHIENIPNVIGVAEGNSKVESVTSLLSTKLINTLVVDVDMGRKLLDFSV